MAVRWLWGGYSDSREDKYIKLEPVSAVSLCKAISIADRLSLTGSCVIQSLSDGCFIKVLYSSSTYTADVVQNKVHQGTMKQSGS